MSAPQAPASATAPLMSSPHMPMPSTALAAELLDKAGDAVAQLLLDHRTPRDEGELARFLDQRIFAADELHGLPIGAGDAFAARRRVEGQATLTREVLAGLLQLAPRQRREHAARIDGLV